MKITVIGAGAIGGLVSGYLKKEGEDILLIARPNDVKVIQSQGLNIQGVRGNFKVNIPVKERLDQKPDLVILAVKTQDIEEAIEQNKPFITQTKILTTQNGIRAEEILSKDIACENIYSSIVMFGATYLPPQPMHRCGGLEPAKIVHNFEGELIIGRLNALNNSGDFLESIKNITQKAFNTQIANNIKGMKWTKIFINLNNCLPAILGESMQESFSHLEICKISIGLWKEAKTITDKAGIKLEDLPTFSVSRLNGLLSLPLDESAKIYSGIMTNLSKEPLYGSILQSIKRNRPSEIDYINGEIVRLARENNLAAPLNKKLVEMVHQIERTNKFFSVEELRESVKEFFN